MYERRDCRAHCEVETDDVSLERGSVQVAAWTGPLPPFVTDSDSGPNLNERHIGSLFLDVVLPLLPIWRK